MNHDEDETSHLPSGRLEIDALLDGEAVDKDALRRALDDAGARDYLIDVLLLRQITRDTGPRQYLAPGVPRGPLARGTRWIAAGLILAAGTGSGYVYGQRSLPSGSSSFEVAVETAPPVAPEPTDVIRFEPGVDWTRITGSN
jgi:hypothetical protein